MAKKILKFCDLKLLSIDIIKQAKEKEINKVFNSILYRSLYHLNR
jgi:hypothetical protein